ncbi:hypothetical protein [Microbulbifer hainanensis]|uniref:hypothetical protein n=1 Tax=Microbulbifer hainanensis TaxID=2735675 RepID=UPI0018665298|nr:hypothetical protein [Microbulbifer hainanensis]
MTYKISFDYINFLNLDLDMKKLMFTIGKSLGGMKAFKNYCWDNKSLADAWQDIGAAFVKVEGLDQTEKPDITIWNGANFVLSPKAYDLLAEQLSPLGEFLPITIDGQTYQIFNCLNTVEADKNVSEAEISDDLWMGVKSLGFKKEDVENNLVFKTRFDRCGALYCGDQFRNLVKIFKLKGLNFNEDLLTSF